MDREGEACTHFEIYALRALRQEKIVVGWEWEDTDAVHRVGEVRGVYLFIITILSRFSHYMLTSFYLLRVTTCTPLVAALRSAIAIRLSPYAPTSESASPCPLPPYAA